MTRSLGPHTAAAAALAAVAALAGCGGGRTAPAAWPLPNANLSGTRAAGSLTAGDVATLRVRWRFRFTEGAPYSGRFASTPVAAGGTVYVQDLASNVYALAAASGKVRWERRFRAPNEGPNGLAIEGSRVYGATDADAFALARSSGRLLWRRHLTGRTAQFVDVAPVPWKGLVFTSTVGYAPFGRGTIYALDAATGAVRWRFDTIEKPWRYPREAGGGGVWYPVSVDDRGRLYAGNSNPSPWGGSAERPNGGAFPGPARYTDSLLVLDARTGRLIWHDQVTPHDVRDYDFQATPILARIDGRDVVIGAGKAGRVIAWDRASRRRLWSTAVGLHRNDTGPLPARRVTVCPGLLGGVETPMAYDGDRLFVPVVDLCGWGAATARQDVASVDPTKGRGRLVALEASSGRTLWERRFPSPDFGCATVAGDVVLTSTYDGTVYALDAREGTVLRRLRMRAGINSCPAVAGDLVLVGAGVPRPGGVTELVALSAR